MAKQVHRYTLFKIPDNDGITTALKHYDILKEAAKKDGSQYILDVQANRLCNNPRGQGFTVCAETTFASIDDMRYYDEKCPAHLALKKAVGPRVPGGPAAGGVLTYFYERE